MRRFVYIRIVRRRFCHAAGWWRHVAVVVACVGWPTAACAPARTSKPAVYDTNNRRYCCYIAVATGTFCTGCPHTAVGLPRSPRHVRRATRSWPLAPPRNCRRVLTNGITLKVSTCSRWWLKTEGFRNAPRNDQDGTGRNTRKYGISDILYLERKPNTQIYFLDWRRDRETGRSCGRFPKVLTKAVRLDGVPPDEGIRCWFSMGGKTFHARLCNRPASWLSPMLYNIQRWRSMALIAGIARQYVCGTHTLMLPVPWPLAASERFGRLPC